MLVAFVVPGCPHTQRSGAPGHRQNWRCKGDSMRSRVRIEIEHHDENSFHTTYKVPWLQHAKQKLLCYVVMSFFVWTMFDGYGGILKWNRIQQQFGCYTEVERYIQYVKDVESKLHRHMQDGWGDFFRHFWTSCQTVSAVRTRTFPGNWKPTRDHQKAARLFGTARVGSPPPKARSRADRMAWLEMMVPKIRTFV